MAVRLDDAGNLRGLYPGSSPNSTRLFIGSHLDTVSHAGAFDGVLGVVLAVALVDLLEHQPLPFAIEVVGFSEEEGVRFGIPFIGSRALAGSIDEEFLSHQDMQGRSIRVPFATTASIHRAWPKRALRTGHSDTSSFTSSRDPYWMASDFPSVWWTRSWARTGCR